jgi:hypothetical protein
MQKPWYKSRTVWINVLTLLTLIMSTVVSWPELSEYSMYIAYALTIINIILRFITEVKIK